MGILLRIFLFLLDQGSLCFSTVFGDGEVVYVSVGMSKLFCSDVAYVLCEIVMVWGPF